VVLEEKQNKKKSLIDRTKRETSKRGTVGGRVRLQIVGLDRMDICPPERQTVRLPPTRELSRMRFSAMRDRRKSLHAVIIKNEFNMPIMHRPGWSGQRINTINVDIQIESGWSIVPLSEITELKRLTREATDEYLTRMACEKLGSNLRFYRSLNTRKTPSMYLDTRIRDCMVSYSAATSDNSVGRVGPRALDRVFTKDLANENRHSLRFDDRSKYRAQDSLRGTAIFNKLFPNSLPPLPGL